MLVWMQAISYVHSWLLAVRSYSQVPHMMCVLQISANNSFFLVKANQGEQHVT